MSIHDEFIAAAEQLADERRETIAAEQKDKAEKERRRLVAIDALSELIEQRTATENL